MVTYFQVLLFPSPQVHIDAMWLVHVLPNQSILTSKIFYLFFYFLNTYTVRGG